jgi:ATP-dependent DNA ligase
VLRIPYIPPASPILVKQPPTGPNWLHEIKWDGWRCQIIKDADGVRIHTRKGNDWTDQLPGIVATVQEFKARSFAIDGELIGENDGYDFYTLPAAIRRRQVNVVAFDLLFLNGKDLRRFPLEQRKDALTKLVGTSDVIQLAETFGDPIALLKAAEEHGMEGIVSKRTDLPYRSGRCIHWHKAKTAGWATAHADRGERFKRKKS